MPGQAGGEDGLDSDAGEHWDRINQDGNGGGVGHAAVMLFECRGGHHGFEVVGRFHQGQRIAQFGGAARARDGFRRGVHAGSGNQDFRWGSGFTGRNPDAFGFVAREHDGFAGGTGDDVAGERELVVDGQIGGETVERERAVGMEGRGKRGEDAAESNRRCHAEAIVTESTGCPESPSFGIGGCAMALCAIFVRDGRRGCSRPAARGEIGARRQDRFLLAGRECRGRRQMPRTWW